MTINVYIVDVSGNRLPTALRGAAVVEHESSFIILGGLYVRESGGSSRTDKIYKWEDTSDGGQWIKMPTTLKERKDFITAINVASSSFKSCQPGVDFVK